MSMIEEWWHPEYRHNYQLNWLKWRMTWESGEQFITHYLKKFAVEESDPDFEIRKSISYMPAFAKIAIVEIKNAIFQRMADISRTEGHRSYQDCVGGDAGGVDRMTETMTGFIGKQVLPELLVMAKVGVYVDMPSEVGTTVLEGTRKTPYVYVYTAEDIISWKRENDRFTNLMLRDTHNTVNVATGLPDGTEVTYRHVWIGDNGFVHVEVFDKNMDSTAAPVTLEIREIPFTVATLPHSLMTDICGYQVALLNLASADVNFAHKANVPFYTEQYDPRLNNNVQVAQNPTGGSTAALPAGTPGSSQQANTASRDRVQIGSGKGRRYPLQAERPGFIHPSPEPLRVSMEKQKQMKEDIRLLVNLALSALKDKMQSAETKQMEQQDGLEAGLSAIGLELEKLERNIAHFWAMYTNSKPATVHYPRNYSLKSDGQRYEEAKLIEERSVKIPSLTYQKEIKKEIVRIMLGHKVSNDVLMKIQSEIDAAQVMDIDYEILKSDIETGLVTTKTASEARGYPSGEAAKAADEHAERLARIAESQAKATDANGVNDQQTDPNASKKQKQDKPVRGDGK